MGKRRYISTETFDDDIDKIDVRCDVENKEDSVGIDDTIVNKQTRIKEILQTLEVDASSQYNYLNARQSLNWDAHDKSNWFNTVELIIELAELLGVQIEKNIDDGEVVDICDLCGEEHCVCDSCEECDDEECECEEIVDKE